MAKRKRSGKDQEVDEERHTKIRVQEVAIEGAKAAVLGNGAGKVTHAGFDASKAKPSRKKKGKEAAELGKTDKVVDGGQEAPLAPRLAEKVESAAKASKLERRRGKRESLPEGKDQSITKLKESSTIRNGKTRGSSLTTMSQWKTSDTIGGQMINLDPIFSRDEQYMIIAYDTSIAVYSTSTSLLVRSFQVHESDTITGLALDSSYDSLLYVTTLSGHIGQWEWKEGQRRHESKASSDILACATVRQSNITEGNGLIYTIEKSNHGKWLILAHRLADKEKRSKPETKTLLEFDSQLTHLIVSNGGKTIVASSGRRVIIGASDSPVLDELSEVSYVWRVANCPEWIVSMDIRCRPSGRTSKKQTVGGGTLEAVDVVLGGLQGAINVFDDLHQKLLRNDKASKDGKTENVVCRTLHWHRNAVLSVKWSLDGESSD